MRLTVLLSDPPMRAPYQTVLVELIDMVNINFRPTTIKLPGEGMAHVTDIVLDADYILVATNKISGKAWTVWNVQVVMIHEDVGSKHCQRRIRCLISPHNKWQWTALMLIILHYYIPIVPSELEEWDHTMCKLTIPRRNLFNLPPRWSLSSCPL
jgi:hypothetical protein